MCVAAWRRPSRWTSMEDGMGNARGLALFLIVAALTGPALADGGAAHRSKQTPPVRMGTSGGSLNDRSNAFCCGGTLGALVTRDGVLSILSNNHVLARSGGAAIGEDTIQPGLIDVGCNGATSNVVGDFPGNYVPLGSGIGGKNVDAALSTARSGQVDTTGEILDVGIPCTNIETPTLGLAVAKSGRTTGYTTGTIQSISTSVSIQYQKGCNSGKKFTIGYTGQVVIAAASGSFSAGGDSGSLIVSNDGTLNPTALLYAGNSSQTIGNPIQDVVNAFSAGGHTFRFVGNDCAGATSSTSAGFTTIGKGGRITPLDGEVDFVRTVKERYEPDLFGKAGVIGVGVGIDETDPTRAAILVYFNTGNAAHPQPGLFPSELDGVKVRVIPTEPFVAQ